MEEAKVARAELRHARISSRKVKIVIDTIRGKKVDEAIAILKYTNKAAAPLVEKLVKSAKANAINNHKMDETKLYVAEIYANQGPTMKRIMPRAQGRANKIRKRTSHIIVMLQEV
ncbi:MAG: 50S ribosomal protein L22 [Clostridia bacterium]